VNFKGDVKLFDVHFTDEQTGWVVGGAAEMAGGVILYTKDADRTWEVRFGDPLSSDLAVSAVRFVDGKHGWAVQGTPLNARLPRTTDGQIGIKWAQSNSTLQI
jgi:photosystem II stability/assembly factor-like uncharacterized protein